jgi:F420-dependent oxidoreductase-like protein
MIKLGYQLPFFDFPGIEPDGRFEHAVAIAHAAERSGFDTFLTMDHVHQPIAEYGPEDVDLMEAYTTLSAIAARTTTINLGTLVTPVTLRPPALLAKMVTTLDVISKGRAIFSIGSGWHEPEHHAYGIAFPQLRQRAEQVEEAIGIAKAMFLDQRPVTTGGHHRVTRPINRPQPIRPGGPPILIGGSGEKRTFPLMAKAADYANLTSTVNEVPAKLNALHRTCEQHGRDPKTLATSTNLSLVIADTQHEAETIRDNFFAARGLHWNDLDTATKAFLDDRLPAGDHNKLDELISPLLEAGLDGITINLPAQFHDLDAITTAGPILRKIVGMPQTHQ